MKRPNFLFIMTDTQATNMVGCYSGKPLNTQNIDSLAAEGIRFNSAYTCSPVCTPARAGVENNRQKADAGGNEEAEVDDNTRRFIITFLQKIGDGGNAALQIAR